MSAPDGGEAGIRAYLRHQAQQRQATYVAQGRRYGTMALPRLEAAWAEAFVAMCLHGDPSRVRDLDDLTAEIGLRDRPVPAHLVAHAMPGIRARARQRLDLGFIAGFGERVGAFLRQEAEEGRDPRVAG